MHQSVANQWRAFNTPFEGLVPFMYADVKGLVTIGMGNLIDPVSAATSLPFQKRSKPAERSNLNEILAEWNRAKPAPAKATTAEIVAEWNKVKTAPNARKGWTVSNAICKLELSPAAVDDLIRKKLAQNEKTLKQHKSFAGFDDWPADAQMALLSMAWAMGPAFGPKWPKFSAAFANKDAPDFETAAANCRMSEAGNPGLVPRNNANQHLFRNASAVQVGAADGFYGKSTLYYPQVCMKPITITS